MLIESRFFYKYKLFIICPNFVFICDNPTAEVQVTQVKQRMLRADGFEMSRAKVSGLRVDR